MPFQGTKNFSTFPQVAKQFYKETSKSPEAGGRPAKVFDIPGPKKAAILMVALGQEASSHIFKSLNEKDVETLTAQIARLEGVTPEMREFVLQEFQQISSAQEYVSQGGMEFAQQILEQSLGSRRAARNFGKSAKQHTHNRL